MPKKYFWCLIIIMSIYVFLAMPGLKEPVSADSVFLLVAADELSGSCHWVSFGPIDQRGLWHPPLYLIILTLIKKIFGVDIVYIRVFNLICGLISIILIYFISSRLYKNKRNYFAPLIACFLFSINPLVNKGSLNIEMDSTILTMLSLLFIFLFLSKRQHLNLKNITKLSFVFALLLCAKLTTPVIMALAILFYLFINKKNKEILRMIVVFIAGFIFFWLFWALYCLWFGYPLFILFSYLLNNAQRAIHHSYIKFAYDIFRAMLWFSPFFLLLWLVKINNRLYEIFKNKISDNEEDLLLIVSIIVFIFYLMVLPITHALPRYHLPVIPLITIIIADVVTKASDDIWNKKMTFIVIFIGAVIYHIIFVGDLLYLTNYAIKEKFIKSNFDISVLYKEYFNILYKLSLSLVLFLIILIFYHKVKGQKFISSTVTASLIMFVSSSLALDIIQYRADYQVILTYGKKGTKDVVKFLKTKVASKDKIIAPEEIIYYLGAVNSGFVLKGEDLSGPEDFLGILEDVNPACVVYGIGSNTIEQYRDIFSCGLIFEYFIEHHFRKVDIGSYTLWIKYGKNQRKD